MISSPYRARCLVFLCALAGAVTACDSFKETDEECVPPCAEAEAGAEAAAPLLDASGAQSSSDAMPAATADTGAFPFEAGPAPAADGLTADATPPPPVDDAAADANQPLADAAPPPAEAGPSTYTTSCTASGATSCTCNAPDPGASGTANDQACDVNVVPGSVCCADSNWPSPGATCSCLTAECSHPAGGGCECSLGSGGEVCNDGVVCCVSPEQECLCTSGVSTCWEGYRTVSQCDAPAIGCGSGIQVTACSVAR